MMFRESDSSEFNCLILSKPIRIADVPVRTMRIYDYTDKNTVFPHADLYEFPDRDRLRVVPMNTSVLRCFM